MIRRTAARPLRTLAPLAFAAVAVAATSAAAQGYTDPPRAWSAGFGQGIIEANVRNNDGATLRVACPAGSETAKPSLTLELAPRAAATTEAKNLEALIEIDGRSNVWSFDRNATPAGDPVAYSFDAFNFRVEAAQKDMVAQMRRGRSVTVYIPPERIKQTFTLTGAGAALDGCD